MWTTPVYFRASKIVSVSQWPPLQGVWVLCKNQVLRVHPVWPEVYASSSLWSTVPTNITSHCWSPHIYIVVTFCHFFPAWLYLWSINTLYWQNSVRKYQVFNNHGCIWFLCLLVVIKYIDYRRVLSTQWNCLQNVYSFGRLRSIYGINDCQWL